MGQKISEQTLRTALQIAASARFEFLDVDDTTEAASGTLRAVEADELANALAILATTRTAQGDADYTILSTDRWVSLTAITASRTFTLPDASAAPGAVIVVFDESGSLSTTVMLSIAPASGDAVEPGTFGGYVLDKAHTGVLLKSNGADRWHSVALNDDTTDIQIFTADGTWRRPAGRGSGSTLMTRIVAIGGGGGGGSGRKDAAGTARSGGGGGGGGAYADLTMQTSQLGSTETVTVPAAATGGAGAGSGTTGNTTNGNPGAAGGDVTFGSWLRARGGGGGAGGTATTAAGGAGGTGAFPGGAGGTSSATVDATAGGASAGYAGAGGGAGNGRTTANTDLQGGAGGAGNLIQATTPTGGTSAAGSAGGAGGANVAANVALGGAGGGGGWGNAGTGPAGGAGGRYGAGGGGAGRAVNGSSGNSGGDGASGICIVITW